MPFRLLSAANRLWSNQGWIARALSMAAVYAAWTAVFRLLILTFVTFFLLPPGFVPTSGPAFWLFRGSTGSSRAGADGVPPPLPKFEEITDILSANELPLLGFSAVLFLAILRWLNPLTSTTTAEIVSRSRLKKSFAPGFLHGATFAVGIILAFLISGSYEYLGFYLQFDELALTFPSIVLRVTAVIAFVYCEEYLFRRKILEQLRAGLLHNTGANSDDLRSDILAAVLTAILYCAIKALQFELSFMHVITVFLVSTALGLQSTRSGDFTHGAGFWAALLVVFHVIFSLPIFGTDFSGILMVKYQAAGDAAFEEANTARLLSGGSGGPLASIALQILLAIELGRSLLRRRKYFRTPSSHS